MKFRLRNPYQRANITLAGLASFSSLVTLIAWGFSIAGYADDALFWIGAIFLAFISMMLIVIWLLGRLQVRRARAFLESERPLVRWTYSAAEWQQLKEARWQDEKGDWKVQWGCLTLLLGSAGLLTGIMLGLEEGASETVFNGLIGFALGSLIGGMIGVVVAGGNFLGARQAHRQSQPGVVALGVNEIFASDDYFGGNGDTKYIREVAIRRGRTTTIEFTLEFPPRPRMPREEQWTIPVPDNRIEEVDEILPRLAPNSQE